MPRTAWQVMSAPVGAAQNARASTANGRAGNPIAPPGEEGTGTQQTSPARRGLRDSRQSPSSGTAEKTARSKCSNRSFANGE